MSLYTLIRVIILTKKCLTSLSYTMTKNAKEEKEEVEEVEEEIEEVEETEEEEVEEEDDNEEEEVEEDDKDVEIANLKKKNGILNRKLTKAGKTVAKKKVTKKAEVNSELSTKDVFSIINAKVDEEDIDEVVKASKLLGKSIKDTLQDDTFKAILAKKVEFRKTAKGANKKGARASGKKLSDNQLLENAKKGIIPEKGSEDAEALYWARRQK